MSFMDEFKSGSAPGLSADRLNEPFHLISMVYDSVNDKIDLTFGRGRVVFLDTIVEKVAESAQSILIPAINTTYYTYLKNDGSYTHNTTGTTPVGALKLWAVSTGATVDSLTKSDMRALIDASGKSAQDNLDTHEAALDPHPQYALDGDAPNAHASTHASAGSDPIAPADIGALPATGKAVDSSKLNGVAESESSAVSTIVKRNASGDINARLFRSEYDTTNATVNYIMTQIDTVTNNYIRPSTPAQVKSALGIDNLGKSAKGTYTGTGAVIREINVGFKPRIVRVMWFVSSSNLGITEIVSEVNTDWMIENRYNGNGVRDANQSGADIKLTANGFTVGSIDFDIEYFLNDSTVTYRYVAIS